MASSLLFIVVLCLTTGLWTGANATCGLDHCCKVCPQGWAMFGERCYQFNNVKKTWAEAEHFCTTIGGNLASLESDDVYKALREGIFRVSAAHTNTWVGGYDSSHEGIWLWSDGRKFDFKGWADGEPNNSGGGENCMEINFKGKDFVNDIKCNQKKAFLCARDPQ
ncbi:galactose-specific lectin nattectin-like [Plectropomus leopardus]|uniref:galactose-specific lectin nattectin-like n=1 Tax=Plectropomus leopardus TaxID=160734 RepID=UPI001C4CC8DD|nr:galactose-specific lectin nattectin-like [Plectropomus leopardus]